VQCSRLRQHVSRPGRKRRSEGLKEDYGVSVSTLREILNRLVAEGFVLAEGRRAFEVAPISVEKLRDLAELRLLLEAHAMPRPGPQRCART